MTVPFAAPRSVAGHRTRPDRLRSLDGLRGVSAVVVVLYHLSLIRPSIAAYQVDPDLPAPPFASANWFILCTPLKLLTSGSEAVVVFFVLSGLVLTRAVSRPSAVYDWMGYYPRRLVRLTVPVAAATALAAVLVLVSSQDPAKVESLWLKMDSVATLTVPKLILDLDLLFGPGILVNPVWSLRYEILFSLLLPVFVLVVRRFGRAPLPLILASTALTAVGAVSGSPTLTYLPMFMVGSALADVLPGIDAWSSRLSRSARIAVFVLGTVGALTLIDLRWALWSFGLPGSVAVQIGVPASLLGALGVVLTAGVVPGIRSALEGRSAAYLGRVSFSLYLVHVPVIYAVANLLSGRPLILIALISIGLIAGLTVVFSRFIEVPAHRLSQSVGRRATALAAHD